MFHIIRLDTNETLEAFITDGKQASERAKYLTDWYGVKCQPRRMVLEDWKKREADRFTSGEYEALPWASCGWWVGSIGQIEHFAHVSVRDKGKLAFTESPEKGQADRQTAIKPGAYLTRYYSDRLSTTEIQDWAREYAGMYEEHTLRFAHTADEIESVYVQGPNSCMSHPASEYSSDVHPVRAYAAGDLAVAYIAPEEGAPTARVLCWPSEKLYGRIYGDKDRLLPLLEKEGYTSGPLTGARLERIEQHGSFVCPYIDNIYSVEDCGDCLRIGGNLDAQSTNGLISMEGERCRCASCGDPVDEDGTYITPDGDVYCEHCAGNHSFICDHCGERIWHESGVEVDGRYTWCQSCAENDAFFCDHCNEYHSHRRNDPHDVQGETWCRECVRDDAFLCGECEAYFPNDNMDNHHEDCCRDCARDLADGEAPKPAPYHCDDPAQQSLPLEAAE